MYTPNYYIVFDIERNFRPYKSEFQDEIVEIGALKIDAKSLNVIEEFSCLINPMSPISKHTTKLTGITKTDVKTAPEFPEAIKLFRDFVGEEYLFVTWGKDDYSFLVEDCILHDEECPYIGKERRFDVQNLVFNAYESLFEQQPNLKFAIEQLQLEWEGEQHRAFYDAKNTANILVKVLKEKDIRKPYKRTAELVLVKNGVLTDKGKKIFKNWVFKELKHGSHETLNWPVFEGSDTWSRINERYNFEPNTLEQVKSYFPAALEKAMQQLEVLAEMNAKKLLETK
ncbi:exonuclease [Bacillus luti]|nr:glycosyl transferase [Bacillus cereus]